MNRYSKFDLPEKVVRVDAIISQRIKHLRGFVDIWPAVLDVGDPNVVGQALYLYADNTAQTDFDFSVRAPEKKYNTILCFEVIEHVMNPLQFLIQLRGFLHPDGRLYLTTPLERFGWHVCDFHFTEYKKKQLTELVEKAGLEVLRYETFPTYPWGVVGLRPIIKRLVFRTQMLELVR